MNEGYFTLNGDNNSENFSTMTPFLNNPGNTYAKIIHDNSNSYGYPYADSNLKVLIEASTADVIKLTICTDDEKCGYDTAPPKPSNNYQFGIGSQSSSLGTISIGSCIFKTANTTTNAYGGYLPTVTDWTKMYFSGPDKYIWIKCSGEGQVVGADCFMSNGKPVTISWENTAGNPPYVLTWPSEISWNPAKSSPDKPTN